MEKKLYRDPSKKVIAGVCAGLADYFNIDVTIVRLIFVLTLIYHGGGTLVYIVLWIVMPRRTGEFNEPVVDYTVNDANTTFNRREPWKKYNYKLNKNKDIAQIGGAVLILLGVFFLLDQFDFIPYWLNFEQFWPVILVVIGLWLIFRPQAKPLSQNEPVAKEDWKDINPENNTSTNNDTLKDI